MDLAGYDDQLREMQQVADANLADSQAVFDLCYQLNIRTFHQAALHYARKGLARNPYHSDLFYELIIACSLDTAHILEDLLRELEVHLSEKPEDQGAQRNLALVHYFLEQDDEAEAILMAILANLDEPDIDPRTFEVLAQLEHTRQNFEAGIEYCEKANSRSGPKARTVRLKGLCYLDLGQEKKAMSLFKKALHLEPNFVWACHSLGALHLEREEYAEAFRHFGRATSINPSDPGNYFLMAEAFMDLKSYDLAASELHKLLYLGPEKSIEAEVFNALGYIDLQTNRLDQALEHLNQAIDLEPELALAYFNMGMLAVQKKDPALAEIHFRKALTLDPQGVESHVELGFLFLARKELVQAKQSFETALEIHAQHGLAYLGLSKIYQKEKNTSAQLKNALRAFECDEDHPEICNNLGIAYECNGSPLAESAYLRALDLFPQHAAAANNLGYFYERQMKQFPDKAAHFKSAAMDAWKTRFRICYSQGKSTRAARTHLLKLGLTEKDLAALEFG